MFDNPRAGSPLAAIGLVLASLISAAFKLLGYLPNVGWAWIAVPAGYVVVKLVIYDLIRNAVREGVTQAAQDTTGEAKQDITLNAGIFSSALDGEMVG
jgi:hypothetical protein